MASLDLVPDLSIFLAQSTLFAASYYVVQKLIVIPYLELRTLRENKTFKPQKQAEQKALLASQKTVELEECLSRSRKTLRKEEEALGKQAQEESSKKLLVVKRKAKDSFEQAEKKLREELLEQKNQVPTKAKKVAGDLFNKLMSTAG